MPTAGEFGAICYYIYYENGPQSAGTPYRVALNKQDFKKGKLVPRSKVKGTLCENDPMVLGEQLSFGQCLPINIGSIRSPKTTLLGTCTINFLGDTLTITNKTNGTNDMFFEEIPGEDKTKYGTLASHWAKTMILKFPRISDTPFKLVDSDWPWCDRASPSPIFKANFNFKFYVDNFPVYGCSEDRDRSSKVKRSGDLLSFDGDNRAEKVNGILIFDKCVVLPNVRDNSYDISLIVSVYECTNNHKYISTLEL